MCRTLVALKSIPTTRAAGQRAACFAACDVPQPAMRVCARSSVNGLCGQKRWKSARRLFRSLQRRRTLSESWMGRGYGYAVKV